MMAVCLSVCLSVCPMPCAKSRTVWHSKLKIGRGKPLTRVTVTYLEVSGSKVKVSRPINAVTENQPYLQKGQANEL